MAVQVDPGPAIGAHLALPILGSLPHRKVRLDKMYHEWRPAAQRRGWVSYMRTAVSRPDAAVSAATSQMAAVTP